MPEEHIMILLKGPTVWNSWRKENPHVRPSLVALSVSGLDFSGIDLSYTDLTDGYFEDVNLTDARLDKAVLTCANLRGAILDRASCRSADFSCAQMQNVSAVAAHFSYVKFTRADLTGADLSRAVLADADLMGATLSNTMLQSAVLCGANMSGAVTKGADFTGAMIWTNFSDNDLTEVKGLSKVSHEGVSEVGIETIRKSKGSDARMFLRHCGVPEHLLKAVAGAESGMQFYSCFISYSHKDEAFAKRLDQAMRAANLRVWYAPKDMRGGAKIHEQIEAQIHVHDKLLLVLSESSMASEWVATEVYHTRQRETKEGRKILFPIRLCPFEQIRNWSCFDADTGKDIAREVREYLIPDFSNWKDHTQFKANFRKLLRDLKNSEKQ